MSLPRFTFTDRCRPVAQIGTGDSRIGAVAARWDVSLWDTPDATWSGVEPLWRDISCEAFSWESSEGRMRTTDRYVPGAGTLLARNVTGWADPLHIDNVAALNMRPGRSIRVGVEHDLYGYCWLFRGFIDEVRPSYEPTQTDTVQFNCIDALGEVNRAKLKPVDPPIGDGETAAVRCHNILDLAAWPDSKRDIAPTSWPLIAIDYGGQVADLLGVTAESVGGVVFGDHEANVCFRPRDWQTFTPDTPVDATIGNVDPGDVCPGEWVRPFDRADIATRVIVGRDADTAYVLDDTPAQILYGIEPFERTSLHTRNDPDLVSLAETILRIRGADTAPRVRSVHIDARMGARQLDLMSTVSVHTPSRYRCRLLLPRGLVFDDNYFATGVSHRLDANSWTLDLNLDIAQPFEAGGAYWDQAGWDRNIWSDLNPLFAEARQLIGALR